MNIIFFLIISLYIKENSLNSFCPKLSSKEFIYKFKTWNNFKVIYKCITNNYDILLNPKFLNYDYDYIVFSDNYFNEDYFVWEYYPIPKEIKNLKLSPIKLERYIKINSHLVLPKKYNFSVFIDGNIYIKNDINLLLNELKYKIGNFNLYVRKHPERNCLYDEISAVLYYKKDTFKNIFPQIEKFIQEGFPHNYGLPETNILIRNHFNSNIIKLMNDWWSILFKGSHRDQLSFSYIAWKNKHIKFAYFNGFLYEEYFYKINHKKKKRK